MRTGLKRLLLIILFLLAFSVVMEPVRTRADFGNFAGDSDYGGGGTSGGGGGGGDGFIEDLQSEAIAWAIAIAIVVLLIVWFILYTFIIEPIINFIRKKKPEEKTRSVPEQRQKLRPIGEYKTLDPGFKEAALRERLSNLYLQLQDAWHELDLESLRPYLTDGFYNQSERQLAEKRRSHIIPFTERIAVLEVKLSGFYQEEGLDHIVARLKTRIIAYEIFDPGESGNGKNAKPRVISGSKTQEKFMEYEWDLCRKTGVQTEGLDGNAVKTVTSPKCGAPLNINQTAQCPYCGSVVTVENEDWALNNIKGISQRTGR